MLNHAILSALCMLYVLSVWVTSTVRWIPDSSLIPGNGGGCSSSWLMRSYEDRSGCTWLCTVVTVTASLSGRRRRCTSLSNDPRGNRAPLDLAYVVLFLRNLRRRGRRVARLPADIPRPVSIFDHKAMLTVAYRKSSISANVFTHGIRIMTAAEAL